MTAVDSGLTSEAFPSWLTTDATMAEALPLDSALLDLCPSLTGATTATAPAREMESSAFAAVSPCASLSPPSPYGSSLSSPEWATGAEGAWGLEAWAFPALVEGMAEARAGGGAALAALEEELQSTTSECALDMTVGHSEGERESLSTPQPPPTKKRKRSESNASVLPSEKELCRMTSAQLTALRESLVAPLSAEEESRLASSWRRVKNREYSRVSRAKKSRRLEALEARVQALEEERQRLAEENRGLREKLMRVAAAFQEARAAVNRRPSTSAAAAGVCLFAVLLCVGIVGLAPFSSAATHEAALAGRIHRTGRAILATAAQEGERSAVDVFWASLWPLYGEDSTGHHVDAMDHKQEIEEGHSDDAGVLSQAGDTLISKGVVNEVLDAEAVACVEDVCLTEAWAPANCSAAAAA